MKVRKQLIINADDFGYTPGVTYGIIEAHNKGVVTSTTALTVSKYFEEAMALRNQLAPSLAVGVHLALTLKGASPLLSKEEVPSLVDAKGEFLTQQEVAEKVDLEEVYREWDAQIARFYATGNTPDHLDSHHDVHVKTQGLWEVAVKLSEKYDLPIRNTPILEHAQRVATEYTVTTTDRMLAGFYGEGSTTDNLLTILDDVQGNPTFRTYEMSCHPGLIDVALKNGSSYCETRIEELVILTDVALMQALAERNIDLITYADLAKKGQ